jgi:hypothetical protein
MSLAVNRHVGIFFPDKMPRENTTRREWRQSRCRHRSAFTRSTRASWIPSSSTSAKTKAFRKEVEAAGITLGTSVAKMEVRDVEMA